MGKEQGITTEQIRNLYEREPVVHDRKQLRNHLLSLVKARWAVEKVKKEGIHGDYQALATGYDRYQPTTSLLDHVIFYSYLEVLDTNDPEFIEQVHHDFVVLRRLLNEGTTLEEEKGNKL